MNSKFTLLLGAIIILFTSGCQNSRNISVSPISTPAVTASSVKSPAPEAVVGEPIIVGSPEIMETFPIKSPLPEPTSASEIEPTSTTAPAASNAEPIVSSSSTPTSSPPQPTPTYTPYHTPTRVPIETAIHTALEADVRAEQGWPIYTDPVSGLSFQYPSNWEIFEPRPGEFELKAGEFVEFLQDERGHFIHFSIRENPDDLSPLEYLVDEILRSRIKLTRSTLLPEVRQFSGNGFNGVVYQEKDSNVKTRIMVKYAGMTIRIVIVIRGEIGGSPPPSSDYNSTEQEVFKLIGSLQVSGQ